ncbi:MAG: hypothetical protein GY851_21420 [bacterium]|nr:hypothetical protein [bacterium]
MRLVLILLLICGVTTRAGAAVRGANTDPNPGPDGVKPYEMADREEDRVPLATFEDCTRWTVEATGAEASLYRTSEQRLFRPHCGKLVYRGTADESDILLRLEKAIPIPEPWDCFSFWNYGAHWVWGEPLAARALHVSAVVRDADGEEHDLAFDQVGARGMVHRYWFLTRTILLEDVPRPAQFVGLRFQGRKVTEDEPLAVYLGPVYFYQEQLEPIAFEPWPEKLPFPTRPETILPLNKTESFKNRAKHTRDGYVFEYRGDDCNLTYTVTPAPGGLDGIAVRSGKKQIHPCKDGGLKGTEDAKWELVDEQLKDDVLSTRWRVTADGTAKEIAFRYRIQQKSLIVEMEEQADAPGIVEEVDLGRAEPVSDAELFKIPFLNYDYTRAPHLLMAEGLFFFTQFDWYYSDASRLTEGRRIVKDSSAQFNGGAVYTPKTNGERNPLRERLFINVSPDVHEVFPTIPNPASPMRTAQSARLWSVRGGNDYDALYDEARRLRAQGMENVTIRYHEGFWRDGGESYTFRLNAAPGRGGDEAVRNHVRRMQALGWRVGLYTNYTDFAPVNANWNEDWVMRGPRGEWNVSWSRCYAPKPMIAVEQEALNAPQIQAKFGTNHSYCDVHTAVSPMARVDYDHRVPGAATFRRTFECFGRLLLNEKQAYKGPVYSEGANHWWYAGLTDGNYGNAAPKVDQQPLFPDFQLLKIHPLQMDVGMASIAHTLAYGHIGMLNDMKTYYMVQPLQVHYSMVPVKRIAYESKGKLVDTSRALAVGAHETGRIHLEYENGFKVWANVGEEPWAIKAAGKDWTLPKLGHLATTADGATTSFSGRASSTDGKDVHIDWCHGPVSHYLNTNGQSVATESLAGNGAAALKREPFGWELIPDGGFVEFGFDPALIGLQDTGIFVDALTQDGLSVAAPTVEWRDGKLFVIPSEANKAFKYRLVPRVEASCQ